MKTLKLMALTVPLIVAAATLAQDEERMEMKIVVAGAATDEAATIHWIGSGDAGLDMHAMQVGEFQSIVDESGRAVLVTREQDGFRFDVDGETVVIPDMGKSGGVGTHGEYITLADGSDVTADFDVEIVRDHATPVFATPAFANGGVTIISGEPLDAATQESIKAVLQSAGHDVEVTFVDRSVGSDARQVQVIRKKIEIKE